MLKKVKKLIRKTVFSIIRPPSRRSYSQAGEDAIIRYLFSQKGWSKISYLDLGTNVPDDGNNTYLFYLRGSCGVCVEADPSLIGHIKKIRPRDIVLNLGVATDDKSEADFYIFNEPSLNTFDQKEAEFRSSFGTFQLIDTKRIRMTKINQLLTEHFSKTPDLLSIDIEGLDGQVLKELDFNRYPISVVCAETCLYSENHIKKKDEDMIKTMESKGYFVYADTYINTIFVNKDWFYRSDQE